MTPVIASTHTAHRAAEFMSSGKKVIRAETVIDKSRPVTIALLRASIVGDVPGSCVDVGYFGASVVFMLVVSVRERQNTRVVLRNGK